MKVPVSTRTDFRIIVNSLPKSGTHLLRRVLSLFPHFGFSGIHIDGLHVGYRIWRRLGLSYALYNRLQTGIEKEVVPVGLGMPLWIPARRLRRILSRVEWKEFASAHLMYSNKAREILEHLQYQMLIMVRDPRGVAVSWAHYVSSTRSNPLYEHLRPLSQSQRLNIGIGGAQFGHITLRDVGARLGGVLAWQSHLPVLVVRFEDLIGSRGGGSDELQLATIHRIGEFLDLASSDFDANHIGENAFWPGSKTFRKGQVGGWRNEFNSEHIELMKRVAGRHLIGLGYEQHTDW